MDTRDVRENRRGLEPYSMLVNLDTDLIQRHRTLKRQLCLIRTAVAFLLLVCMSLGTVIYFQPREASKDKHHTAAAKGMQLSDNAYKDHDYSFNLNFITLTMEQCKNEASGMGAVRWSKSSKMAPKFELATNEMSLKFLQSGWYQISLQITFGNNGEKNQKERPDLSYQLIHNSESYGNKDIVVLSAYLIGHKKPHWIKSLYSEKIIHIQQMDSLHVNISDMRFLHCESTNVGRATFLTAQLLQPTK